MENKKYYTNSEGQKIDVSTLHPTHIKNAISKKYDELFLCKTKNEFSIVLGEINNLKDEYHKRLNEFYDKLGD